MSDITLGDRDCAIVIGPDRRELHLPKFEDDEEISNYALIAALMYLAPDLNKHAWEQICDAFFERMEMSDE